MTDQATSPKEITEPESVIFLPGYAFFVDILEVPESLDSTELENFAELSLESLSPFPVEQLCWGFIHSEETTQILLYATHRERLEQLGYKDLETASWIFPDFVAPVTASNFTQSEATVLESELSATRIALETENGFPTEIIARKTAEELRLPNESAATKRIRISSAGLDDKELPTLELEDISTGESSTHALDLSPSALWHADIRPIEFKKLEKSRRRMASVIGRFTAYAVLIALLLLCFEGLLIGGGLWSTNREAIVENQLSAVRRIEDKQSLINKLDQVAQSELRPIAMLDALNQTRPRGIYFTSTTTEGRNRITIDGIANTINELNAYTDSLRKSGNFELIGNPQSITRSGRTTFSVTLDYFHQEEQEGAEG